MTRPAVYTPNTLAERWECSERHIRNMIANGELPAFRLGGKLLRIKGEDVERVECQNGASQSSEANSASPGTIQQSQAEDDVISLEQQIQQRRSASPRLDTQSLRARAGRR